MKILTIIILQYNETHLTKKLLESIVKFEGQNLHKYNVILIDNKSPDGDQFDQFQIEFPFLILRKNESNFGFANGINPHLKNVNTEYTLLINNDAILLNDAIHITLEFLIQNQIDGATCEMRNEHNVIMNNFSLSPSPYFRLFVNTFGFVKLFETIVKKFSLITKVNYINGGFLMLRQNAFKDVNYFCDKYFMYTEDLDLMIKLLKQKKSLYYNPNGKILHYDGVSSAKKWSTSEKKVLQINQMFDCYLRHYGNLGLICVKISLLLKEISRLLVGRSNLKMLKLISFSSGN